MLLRKVNKEEKFERERAAQKADALELAGCICQTN